MQILTKRFHTEMGLVEFECKTSLASKRVTKMEGCLRTERKVSYPVKRSCEMRLEGRELYSLSIEKGLDRWTFDRMVGEVVRKAKANDMVKVFNVYLAKTGTKSVNEDIWLGFKKVWEQTRNCRFWNLLEEKFRLRKAA